MASKATKVQKFDKAEAKQDFSLVLEGGVIKITKSTVYQLSQKILFSSFFDYDTTKKATLRIACAKCGPEDVIQLDENEEPVTTKKVEETEDQREERLKQEKANEEALAAKKKEEEEQAAADKAATDKAAQDLKDNTPPKTEEEEIEKTGGTVEYELPAKGVDKMNVEELETALTNYKVEFDAGLSKKAKKELLNEYLDAKSE